MKSITVSSTSQEEMLLGSTSTDIGSDHVSVDHACHEQPNSLMKSFTEQLSITSQVSVDGVNDDNQEEKVRMCPLTYNENDTASVNELQVTIY